MKMTKEALRKGKCVRTRHSMVDTIRGEDGPLQYTVTSGAIIRGKTYYI